MRDPTARPRAWRCARGSGPPSRWLGLSGRPAGASGGCRRTERRAGLRAICVPPCRARPGPFGHNKMTNSRSSFTTIHFPSLPYNSAPHSLTTAMSKRDSIQPLIPTPSPSPSTAALAAGKGHAPSETGSSRGLLGLPSMTTKQLLYVQDRLVLLRKQLD